ncbi:MAG: hypothetical protein ACOCT9_01510 [archaeon]
MIYEKTIDILNELHKMFRENEVDMMKNNQIVIFVIRTEKTIKKDFFEKFTPKEYSVSAENDELIIKLRYK